tara:strand:+ start:511 stop:711 length:201 start_codon:yes stop_codon:yes gene_type:complete
MSKWREVKMVDGALVEGEWHDVPNMNSTILCQCGNNLKEFEGQCRYCRNASEQLGRERARQGYTGK